MNAITAAELKSMSDEQLNALFTEYSAIIERASLDTKGRPRRDYFRHQADLASQQAQWDEAHPEAAKALKSAWHADELRRDVLDELDLRAAQRAERDRVFSVLDHVPRIRAAVEKGLEPTQPHDAVQDWARSKSWCLLLLGPVGCGKSTAAAHYAVKFGEQGGSACWVLTVAASRLPGFGPEAETRFEAWRSAGCLVLDDLGTELVTPTWQQALDDVLDYRYQHSLRTILPSNLSASEFKARYGERISDRIRHDGTVCELNAKSLRRR